MQNIKNVYIIANGSNDLYSCISKSISCLLLSLKHHLPKVNIYIFSSIKDVDPNKDFFFHNSSTKGISEQFGIKYENFSFQKINTSKYYKTINLDKYSVRIMDIESFLDDYIKEKDNIVILSGHGGPFQSLLDMSVYPICSINTIKLCKLLKKYYIDVLFLDMCAMNYVETLYELLYKSNINKVITYRGHGPFEGVSYYEFIRSQILDIDICNMYNNILMSVSKKSIDGFNNLKLIQNTLVMKTFKDLNPDFNSLLIELDQSLKSICDKPNGLSLNFIKCYLSDQNERKLYTQYSYTSNSLWPLIVTRSFKKHNDFDPDIIKLDIDSLKNILCIHNTQLSMKSINSMYLKFSNYILNKYSKQV